MRVGWLLLTLCVLISLSIAQQPTAFFGARLHSQIRAEKRTTQLRWYDDLARHSVVYLQLYHDSGYGAYIAQRLQSIPRDRNRSTLDEVYLEKVEGWRFGKFYAPFGNGMLLRESVLAVQSPTRFAIGNLPMRVAYLFNGKERQQGFYARVGTPRGGVSVGVGRHFGIDPHAFALWELPEQPRSQVGYQQLYGADYAFEWTRLRLQMEWLYSGGQRITDAHWLALRCQPLDLPFEPELLLAYQTPSERLSWRLSLQQRMNRFLSLSVALRGHQGTLQLVAIGLRGEL
jgi:hypothetical protein